MQACTAREGAAYFVGNPGSAVFGHTGRPLSFRRKLKLFGTVLVAAADLDQNSTGRIFRIPPAGQLPALQACIVIRRLAILLCCIVLVLCCAVLLFSLSTNLLVPWRGYTSNLNLTTFPSRPFLSCRHPRESSDHVPAVCPLLPTRIRYDVAQS